MNQEKTNIIKTRTRNFKSAQKFNFDKAVKDLNKIIFLQFLSVKTYSDFL